MIKYEGMLENGVYSVHEMEVQCSFEIEVQCSIKINNSFLEDV